MKNKKIFLIVLSALLVMGITAGVVLWAFGGKNKPKQATENSRQSDKAAVTINPPADGQADNSSGDEIADDGTGLTPSEPDITVPDNRTGEKAEPETGAKQPVNAVKAAAAVPTEKKYVQDANPETGISWDGKSAITYRYADGSETTEKRYGGYYEIRPNEWVLYARPIEREEENNHCSHCGKVMGDGTNGTCVRWMMGDMTCPNCGSLVPANTCHTCGD